MAFTRTENGQMTSSSLAFTQYVVGLVQNGRASWAKFHPKWHQAVQNAKVHNTLSEEDLARLKQGLPANIPVPVAYSQKKTFVSYCTSLLLQKSDLFEFAPGSADDVGWRACAEKLINKDFTDSEGERLLTQLFEDIATVGVGVMKDRWEVTTRKVKVMESSQPVVVNGIQVQGARENEVVKDVVVFEGNMIEHVSPFDFFTDAGRAKEEWKKGTYAGCHFTLKRTELAAMEKRGVVFNVEFMRKNTIANYHNYNSAEDVVCLTEVQVKCNPAMFNQDGEDEFEDWEDLYVVWLDEMGEVIRFEPLNVSHGSFTYSVGFYDPNITIPNMISLDDLTFSLNRVISFMYNSRIAAVSNSIDQRWVVDPSAVEMSDIAGRSNYIRLKKEAQRRDVGSVIKAVDSNDVTQGHVGDAQSLMSMMQFVTGINDTTMGQFASGRRSATEARSVMQSAVARMRMVCVMVWKCAFIPLFNRMLMNHRSALSMETFVKICGVENVEHYGMFHQNLDVLLGSSDAVVFDGTLPSEKIFIASMLQEVLTIVMQDPSVALQFNLSAVRLLEEIYKLRGIGALRGFALGEEERNNLVMQMQQVQAIQNPQPTQPTQQV